MKAVIAIIKLIRLDDLREAPDQGGVQGVMVTEVEAVGRRRGSWRCNQRCDRFSWIFGGNALDLLARTIYSFDPFDEIAVDTREPGAERLVWS